MRAFLFLGALAIAASASSPTSSSASRDFMDLSVHKAEASRNTPGKDQVAPILAANRAGLGASMSAADDSGTRQLLLGGGLIILFFVLIFMMQENEGDDAVATKARSSPQASTTKPTKSLHSAAILAENSSKRSSPKASPRETPNPSPVVSAAKLTNVPFADERTLLLDDLRRQEDELKRQEADAWRRQEEAVRIEKEALLRREDELRARYERMEALNPKPTLYIPSSSPIMTASNTTPRSAPLYEPYAAREAREKRQALEAAEQAIVQSSPYISSESQPIGTAPPTSEAPVFFSSYGAASPAATAPTLSGAYGSFGSSTVPATAPAIAEAELTPEQQQTLQKIMEQTGASRDATIRAMKKARQEEEAILRDLEAKRQRAAAAASPG